MKLFDFGKKKEESCCGGESVNTESCCCGGTVNTENCKCIDTAQKLQSIKVLGAGCKACHEMYENTKKALANMGIDIEVEYVTDMEKVMTYGIMSMPGVVVNEQVVSMGKVLKTADIEKLLHKSGL